MCLAIPSKVVKIEENDLAIVDTMGSKRKISTMLINEPINIGDYLLYVPQIFHLEAIYCLYL
jgi:hydrogenase expression/formation protein HypC